MVEVITGAPEKITVAQMEAWNLEGCEWPVSGDDTAVSDKVHGRGRWAK